MRSEDANDSLLLAVWSNWYPNTPEVVPNSVDAKIDGFSMGVGVDAAQSSPAVGSSLIAARVAGSASLEVCWFDGDGELSGVHEFGEPSCSSVMPVNGDGLGSEAFVGKVHVVPFRSSPELFSYLVLYEVLYPSMRGVMLVPCACG
ncbi:hypothetical protein SLA2020_268700 [Shorea laevis]